MTTRSDKIRDFALQQEGAPYIYGGTGRLCTPAYRKQQIKQYPDMEHQITTNCPVLSGKQINCSGCKYSGRKAFDCAQLTRRAAEAAGLTLPSGATSQFNKGDWEQEGHIQELPPNQVAFLYRQASDGSVPHTGTALGDGTAMDARSHSRGVIRQPISSYPWTHYKLLAGQNDPYTGNPIKPEPKPAPADNKPIPPTTSTPRTLRVTKGQPLLRGEDVRQLQMHLLKLGYAVGEKGADGVYGYDSQAAVMSYQAAHRLSNTGVADDRLQAEIKAAATKYLQQEEKFYTVTLTGMTQAQVDKIKASWPQAKVV